MARAAAAERLKKSTADSPSERGGVATKRRREPIKGKREAIKAPKEPIKRRREVIRFKGKKEVIKGRREVIKVRLPINQHRIAALILTAPVAAAGW